MTVPRPAALDLAELKLTVLKDRGPIYAHT